MKRQFLIEAQKIRGWIASEDFKPGTLLPSRIEISARFGCNPHTTLRACQVLITEGLLNRVGYKLVVAPQAEFARASRGEVFVLSYFRDFNRTAGRVLTERRLRHQLLELSFTKHLNLEPVLEEVLAEKPAGIIFSAGIADNVIKFLSERTPIPVVICAGTSLVDFSSIQTDLIRGVEVAVRHLVELGHRHIAHAAIGDADETREIIACYQGACVKLGLAKSASVIWGTDDPSWQAVRHMLLEGSRRHPKTTGLFATTEMGAYATKVFAVPKDLSVVGLFGLPEGIKSNLPLTKVAFQDAEPIVMAACTDLIAQMQTVESGRPPRGACRIFIVPPFQLGKSTRAISQQEPVPSLPNLPSPAPSDPWATWRKKYPSLEKRNHNEWLQLDLSQIANHSMTRQNGWLGAEPLEHFPPGLREIHGVPFAVLDEERNNRFSVVTFRSPRTHSARKKLLPTETRVTVNSKVDAFYFLHGCGYARRVPFAEYIMHFENGRSLSVPLVPLGPSQSLTPERPGDLQPNLQDWWPNYSHDDFPHAHHVKVFDPSNPAAYQRFLYSLEWINPHPDDKISYLEARVDPKAGPTLALVAVSALLSPVRPSP